MDCTNIDLKSKESSTPRDSNKGSCSEAAHTGAAGQYPVEQGAGETPLTGEEHLHTSSFSLKNLQGLTEKVGTLGLHVIRKNRCGAAKKRARKAKLVEAPTGDCASGQPWSAPGGQPQTLQKPSTSGARHRRGHSSTGPKSPENKGHPQGPNK
jgi:hypothetical protein